MYVWWFPGMLMWFPSYLRWCLAILYERNAEIAQNLWKLGLKTLSTCVEQTSVPIVFVLTHSGFLCVRVLIGTFNKEKAWILWKYREISLTDLISTQYWGHISHDNSQLYSIFVLLLSFRGQNIWVGFCFSNNSLWTDTRLYIVGQWTWTPWSGLKIQN